MTIYTINSFLEYYSKIRSRTNLLLETVAPEHMEWTYKRGKFTVADIIRHIAATERYMYAENVKGNLSQYVGCGKELADGYEEVMNFFKEKHEESLTIFKTLSDNDLKKKCITPANIKLPIWKWLRAMIEHEIHHRGQLYIYLNLLDVKTPPMFGMTEEEMKDIGSWNNITKNR